jgi:hypothetical protein
MPLLNFNPRTVGLLGDTLTGVGMGLLNQQPGAGGQYSTMGGIGQGLQYAQGLQQTRRANASDELRDAMAKQQFQMQQEKFGFEKQQYEQQQQSQAAQQKAIGDWVVTQPPDQQALFKAYPEQAAEAFFKSQNKEPWQPKMQTIRRGTQDESGYFDQQGQWVPMSSGAAFAPRQDGSNEYGLAPFYTKDADGTVHAWQLSKGGGMQEVPIPEGQSIAPQTQFLNLGTSQVPVDRHTGEAVPGAEPLPIDVSGEKNALVQGEAQGQGTVALQTAVDTAANAVAAIEQLKTHPGRTSGTGLSSMLDPRNKIPGTDAYNFNVLLEQTKGKVFLEAFQSLKGAGAITEQEGKAGTAAIARLDAAQSEPEFMKALDELQTVIDQGVARAKAKAEGNFTTPTQSGAVPPPPPGFQVVQ